MANKTCQRTQDEQTDVNRIAIASTLYIKGSETGIEKSQDLHGDWFSKGYPCRKSGLWNQNSGRNHSHVGKVLKASNSGHYVFLSRKL